MTRKGFLEMGTLVEQELLAEVQERLRALRSQHQYDNEGSANEGPDMALGIVQDMIKDFSK